MGGRRRRIVDWFVWNHRLSSSPASYVEFRRMSIETDISDVLPGDLSVPTLVLSKSESQARAVRARGRA